MKKILCLIFIFSGCSPIKDTSLWPIPEGTITNLSKTVSDQFFELSFEQAIKDLSTPKTERQLKEQEILTIATPAELLIINPILSKLNNDLDTHLKAIDDLTKILTSGSAQLQKNLSELLAIEIKLVSKAMLTELSALIPPIVKDIDDNGLQNDVLLKAVTIFLASVKPDDQLVINENLADQIVSNLSRLKDSLSPASIPQGLKDKTPAIDQELKHWQIVHEALLKLEFLPNQIVVNNPLGLSETPAAPVPIHLENLLTEVKNDKKLVVFTPINQSDIKVIENILTLSGFQAIIIDIEAFIIGSQSYRDGLSWFKTRENIEWLADIIKREDKKTTNPVFFLKNLSALSMLDKSLSLAKAIDYLVGLLKNIRGIILSDKPEDIKLTTQFVSKPLDLFASQKLINSIIALNPVTFKAYEESFTMMVKVSRALAPNKFSIGELYELIDTFLKNKQAKNFNETARNILLEKYKVNSFQTINYLSSLSNELIESTLNRDIDHFVNLKNSDLANELNLKSFKVSEIVSKQNRQEISKNITLINQAAADADASAEKAIAESKAIALVGTNTTMATTILNAAILKAQTETTNLMKELTKNADDVAKQIDQTIDLKTAGISTELTKAKQNFAQAQQLLMDSYKKESSKIVDDFRNLVTTKTTEIEGKQKSLLSLMTASASKAGEAVSEKVIADITTRYQKEKDDLRYDLERNIKDAKDNLEQRTKELKENCATIQQGLKEQIEQVNKTVADLREDKKELQATLKTLRELNTTFAEQLRKLRGPQDENMGD